MPGSQPAYIKNAKDICDFRIFLRDFGQFFEIILECPEVLLQPSVPKGTAGSVLQLQVLQMAGTVIRKMPRQIAERLLQLEASATKFGRL